MCLVNGGVHTTSLIPTLRNFSRMPSLSNSLMESSLAQDGPWRVPMQTRHIMVLSYRTPAIMPPAHPLLPLTTMMKASAIPMTVLWLLGLTILLLFIPLLIYSTLSRSMDSDARVVPSVVCISTLVISVPLVIWGTPLIFIGHLLPLISSLPFRIELPLSWQLLLQHRRGRGLSKLQAPLGLLSFVIWFTFLADLRFQVPPLLPLQPPLHLMLLISTIQTPSQPRLLYKIQPHAPIPGIISLRHPLAPLATVLSQTLEPDCHLAGSTPCLWLRASTMLPSMCLIIPSKKPELNSKTLRGEDAHFTIFCLSQSNLFDRISFLYVLLVLPSGSDGTFSLAFCYFVLVFRNTYAFPVHLRALLPPSSKLLTLAWHHFVVLRHARSSSILSSLCWDLYSLWISLSAALNAFWMPFHWISMVWST